MTGAIIYFSGTGNTEFAAKLFKNKFSENGIECSMIDISKKRNLGNEYDFYVFGGPIYADYFPDYFYDWINNKVKDVFGKKCIVFSTQSEKESLGTKELSRILEEKGLEVLAQAFIIMPNSYYINGLNKITDDKIIKLKDKASEKVDLVVEKFLIGQKHVEVLTQSKLSKVQLFNEVIYSLEKDWAQRNLTVDYDLCVKCGKCAKNCPTGNISMKEDITFREKCISCQRCIHRCPVNAFLYNGKPIEQYKI